MFTADFSFSDSETYFSIIVEYHEKKPTLSEKYLKEGLKQCITYVIAIN